ncbi:uncharacterized protein BKA55DRAFT_564436 [Fusarium redolens]|uniref:Uncharacterized protein n=1 Tax=Fusarium redolens TaxID=48865 RepID=A0A9P9HDB9_FUSRE|nr:uncharacterized protein BKA55DRAFT_564436 [Fusarium redolens]KAH7255574.1 hypothetical protein BKA55DRAFT_564436 [Fusarium redolens]
MADNNSRLRVNPSLDVLDVEFHVPVDAGVDLVEYQQAMRVLNLQPYLRSVAYSVQNLGVVAKNVRSISVVVDGWKGAKMSSQNRSVATPKCRYSDNQSDFGL